MTVTNSSYVAAKLCPTCRAPVPPSQFRPRVWCKPACRLEMNRRRRELAHLTGELDEARRQVGWSTGVRKARWQREVAWIERAVARQHELVPDGYR